MNKIGVRDLVGFILRSGDLNSTMNSTNTAQAGTRIHQKLQRKRPEDYQAEYYLATNEKLNGHEFTVDGRADGVIMHEQTAEIEEIKTSDLEFATLPQNKLTLYWGQAKVYAHLLMQANPEITEVNLKLTYVQTPNEVITTTEQTITQTEAAEFFTDILDEYEEWIKLQDDLTHEKVSSAQQVQFPFGNYRKGQRELAAVVYKSVLYHKHLFAEAPTGTGKTISTLFPVIKAMGAQLTERVFYLTAKQSTRRVAEEAISLMSKTGLNLHSITLTAKDKIKFPEEADLAPEENPYMLGYYDRVKPALKDLLTHEHQITRPTIEKYARKYTLDPFEFSLDTSMFCDVIIGDYNYLFDPRVHLTRYFEVENPDNFFLIDEAHNLVDRSRDMYSTDLTSAPIKNLIKIFSVNKEENKAILTKLRSLKRAFTAIAKPLREQHQTQAEFLEENEKFTKAVSNLIKVLRKWLAKAEPSPNTETVLDYFFQCTSYLKISEFFGPNYRLRVLLDDYGITVRLFCMDPSPFIADTLNLGGGAILFSATLSPMDYYQSVLGDETDSLKYQLDSPFDPQKQGILVTSYIDTRYRQRDQSIPKIVDSIKALIDGKRGNYLVFTPSNQYLETIYTAFAEKYPDVHLVKQAPAMDDDARNQFLQAFEQPTTDPVLGFALLGGIFSEGIDLVGDKLIGVGIVSVGLPGLNHETDLIRDYFDEKNGHGFEYAYQIPGLNNVFQAAGRLIRGTSDRGIILLMDNRFIANRYHDFFPKSWYSNTIVHNLNELNDSIHHFWRAP